MAPLEGFTTDPEPPQDRVYLDDDGNTIRPPRTVAAPPVYLHPKTGAPLESGAELASLVDRLDHAYANARRRSDGQSTELGEQPARPTVIDSLRAGWRRLNTPLVPQIADVASRAADAIDAPALDRSPLEATARGAAAGVVKGAGDVVAGFTSPANLVMTAAGAGAETDAVKRLPTVWRALKGLEAAGGATFAAEGAHTALTAPTAAEKLMGVAEAAGGAAGALSGARGVRGVPEAIPAEHTGAVDEPRTVSPAAEPAAVYLNEAGEPIAPSTAPRPDLVARGDEETFNASRPAPEQTAAAAVDADTDPIRAMTRAVLHDPDLVKAAKAMKTRADAAIATTPDSMTSVDAPTDSATDNETPRPPAAAADLSTDHLRELRRVVHELDAMPYTPRLLRPAEYGGGLEHVEGTGGAGAPVYNDILEAAPGTSRPSRGTVQAQLERYLAGGEPTNAVQGAIEIARLRLEGATRIPGDGPLSRPKLPPDAGDVPTRLEPRPEMTSAAAAHDDLVEELGSWFGEQADRERDASPTEATAIMRDVSDRLERPPALTDAPFALTPETRDVRAAQPELLTPAAQPDRATSAATYLDERTGEPIEHAPAEARSPSGTTLQATVFPGAKEFAEHDVAPAARAATETAARAADDIRRTFIPESRGEAAEAMGQAVRVRGAQLARRSARAEASLRAFGAQFDRLPHPKDARADVGVQTMINLERGDLHAIPAELQPAATALRDILDQRRREVQARGRLQQALENYFPHIWKNPDQARAALAQWHARGPLQGGKGFLKQRSIDSIEAGLEAGLEPASRNPVTMTLLKIREMDKWITAHDALQQMKGAGVAKYVPIGTPAPDGWTRIVDPIGTVFKNPNIPVKEAYDASVMEGLQKVAADLGISHERGVRIGGQRWGYSVQGGNKVVTRFAGPESVLAHEIGHQIDHQFGLWNRLQQLERQHKAQGYDNWSLADQLRKVTDLTWEGKAAGDVPESFRKYVRRKEEKIANLVEAYVHAPAKLKAVAPELFNVLDELVDATPQLQGLKAIEPSLRLGTRTDTVNAGGAVIGGHWWAPREAAQLLNQHLAPGLAGNALYDVYRAVGNNITSVKLGLSAFHAAVESVNAVLSKAAVALKYGLPESVGGGGKPLFALRKLGEAPVAPILDVVRGSRLRTEYLTKPLAGDATKSMVDALVQAGGRVTRDEMYRTHMGRAFIDAVRQGNYPGAAVRAPLAAIEAVAHPIMDTLVPRLKLGAFADLAEFELGKLPREATSADVQRVLGRAWDSVDNRFGELVYDNLFWPRWVKDVGQLYFRALGWNLGTARELGGAAVDVGKGVRSIARGQAPEFTHRMAYATALATAGTALFGAAYQKLHTGSWPTDLKDYVYPLTGETRADGQPERAKLPTYASDVYEAAHHPMQTLQNKQSDLLSGLVEFLENRDYRNVQVRDPDASIGDQARQVGTWAAGKFGTPIAFSTAQRGTSPMRKVESLVGFGTAPAWVGHSPAEELLAELTRSEDTRTLKQEAAREQRQALREALRAGDRDTARNILAGGALTPRSILQTLRSSRLSALQSGFQKVTLDQALKVYDAATPEERGAIRGLLLVKAARDLPQASGVDQAGLVTKLRRATTLPFQKPPLAVALRPTGTGR